MRLYTLNTVDIMIVKVKEQVERVQFREIAGKTGQTFYIAYHKADYAGSMRALGENGLRPLTRQEALLLSQELIIKELKGKGFYLGSRGTNKRGICTYNNKGELVELKGYESADQKIRVYPGSKPLYFHVDSDTNTMAVGRRFYLIADNPYDYVTLMVVGVKIQADVPDGAAAAKRS